MTDTRPPRDRRRPRPRRDDLARPDTSRRRDGIALAATGQQLPDRVRAHVLDEHYAELAARSRWTRITRVTQGRSPVPIAYGYRRAGVADDIYTLHPDFLGPVIVDVDLGAPADVADLGDTRDAACPAGSRGRFGQIGAFRDLLRVSEDGLTEVVPGVPRDGLWLQGRSGTAPPTQWVLDAVTVCVVRRILGWLLIDTDPATIADRLAADPDRYPPQIRPRSCAPRPSTTRAVVELLTHPATAGYSAWGPTVSSTRTHPPLIDHHHTALVAALLGADPVGTDRAVLTGWSGDSRRRR